jgi:hypothetical protein
MANFADEHQLKIMNRTASFSHFLYPGVSTFLLPRAALAIHIFVEGRRKEINNVVDSKRNCISLTQRVYSWYSLEDGKLLYIYATGFTVNTLFVSFQTALIRSHC